MPDLPAYCQQRVEHAALALGQPVEVLLRRERAQLDSANRVITNCGEFYLAVKSNLEQPAP